MMYSESLLDRTIHQTRYPLGPYLLISVISDQYQNQIETLIESMQGRHRLFYQSSGLGWGSVVLSLNKLIYDGKSLREAFQIPSFRSRALFEYERITKTISAHISQIPLQFPTYSDAMFRTHNFLLRESPLFNDLFNLVENRFEYEIHLETFGPANIANNNWPAPSPMAKGDQKQGDVIELCIRALAGVMPWYVKDDTSQSDETSGHKHSCKLIALLNDEEHEELANRINQIGAMAGIVGISIKTSNPNMPKRIFIEKNTSRSHGNAKNQQLEKIQKISHIA